MRIEELEKLVRQGVVLRASMDGDVFVLTAKYRGLTVTVRSRSLTDAAISIIRLTEDFE